MFWFIVFCLFIPPPLCKGIADFCKWQEMRELKRTDPARYVQLKQLEHQEHLMEEEKKTAANRNRLKTGLTVGGSIVEMFFRR